MQYNAIYTQIQAIAGDDIARNQKQNHQRAERRHNDVV
jgi:hypothetical protein